MRAIVQRVSCAAVEVDGVVCGTIRWGLAVLAAIEEGDGEAEREWMAEKLVNLRVFPDSDEKMNCSLLDTGGQMLLISNFTVAGDTAKGRRPSFVGAMKPPDAERAFEALVGAVRSRGVGVETGVFGAHMDVKITNDGPVTLVLESPAR
jgi:D-tyrosyl-tRNA(Tyr) deacylase